MSSLRSPWGEYGRDNEDRFDRVGSAEHRLLGSLIERSTSAPPLSSDGDLHFGHGNVSLCCLGCTVLFCFVFKCKS